VRLSPGSDLWRIKEDDVPELYRSLINALAHPTRPRGREQGGLPVTLTPIPRGQAGRAATETTARPLPARCQGLIGLTFRSTPFTRTVTFFRFRARSATTR